MTKLFQDKFLLSTKLSIRPPGIILDLQIILVKKQEIDTLENFEKEKH